MYQPGNFLGIHSAKPQLSIVELIIGTTSKPVSFWIDVADNISPGCCPFGPTSLAFPCRVRWLPGCKHGKDSLVPSAVQNSSCGNNQRIMGMCRLGRRKNPQGLWCNFLSFGGFLVMLDLFVVESLGRSCKKRNGWNLMVYNEWYSKYLSLCLNI